MGECFIVRGASGGILDDSITAAKIAPSGFALSGNGEPSDAGDFVGQLYINNSTDDVSVLTGFLSTASGSIASFDDGADGRSIKSLTVDIEPVQAGSGEASPDNIRPISGWTGATLTRTGKNFMKPPAENQTVNGVTFTLNDDGSVTANGTATTAADFYYVGTQTVYEDAGIPTGDYILNGAAVIGSAVGGILIVPQGGSLSAISGAGDLRYSFDANKKYRIFIRINAGQTVNNAVFRPMVRLATETDSAYEPYKPVNTYNISFPTEAETVYGGTLDVTNGVLTVDKVKHTISASEVAAGWANANYSQIAYAQIPKPEDGTQKPLGPNTQGYFLMAEYTMSRAPTFDRSDFIGKVIYNADANRYWFGFPYGTSLTDMQAALDGKFYIYELVNPVTYQLDPIEVKTLLGINNIWADTGDVTVIYSSPKDGETPVWQPVEGAIDDGSITADKLADSAKSKGVAVVLNMDSWTNNTQTVSVDGVTANNNILVAAAPASRTEWNDAEVYCSGQGNGTLTFACSSTLSADVTANVVILV